MEHSTERPLDADAPQLRSLLWAALLIATVAGLGGLGAWAVLTLLTW